MTTENPGYVTIAEAADLIDRTTSTVRMLTHSGFFDQKREWDGTRERTILLRADVENYRNNRDEGKTRPKTKEAYFPVKRESMDFGDWIVGQAIAGLCANPEFLNFGDLRTGGNQRLLVDTAIEIAQIAIDQCGMGDDQK